MAFTQQSISSEIDAKLLLHHDLMAELIESGHIQYKKKIMTMDAFDPLEEQRIAYSAEINVADHVVSGKFMDIDEFEVQGVKFTEEQLIQAVKNTFPEELI